MPSRSIVAPTGAFLHRNQALVFPMLVLAAYASAVPPEEVLGSRDLEHIKDLLAFMFAFLGLTFRALAIAGPQGWRPSDAANGPDLGISRSPLYLANLLILFAIFLMHGNFYVVTFGVIACLLIYVCVMRSGSGVQPSAAGSRRLPQQRGTARLPRVALSGGFAGMRAKALQALAREWVTAATVIGLLLLTEVYEDMPGTTAASFKVALLVLSGALTVSSALVLALRMRTAAAASQPDASGTGPQTRGIRVDSRVRSVDFFENAISFGHLEPILRTTLDAAGLRPGHRLVDIGCGTGRLAIEAARAFPDGEAVQALGIDATPGMIDLARERAREQRSTARFQVGVAEALPLPDDWADAVTSSYFFHHLPPEVKPQALREMWRVLKPGGRLVITDYGRPHGLVGFVASIPMRFNFYEYVRSQLGGELERMIEAERVGHAQVVRRFLGYITVFRLVKPEEESGGRPARGETPCGRSD